MLENNGIVKLFCCYFPEPGNTTRLAMVGFELGSRRNSAQKKHAGFTFRGREIKIMRAPKQSVSRT